MKLCYCVFVVFNLLLVKCVCAGVINKDLFRLDIVHYNDFHDRFEETTEKYPVCTRNDSSCLGGFARLYQEVQTLLKEKPGALLLNAGDTFQGTYWYTLLKWNVTQKFINMLPNDAHAIGNHEFDDGVAGLAPYLAALRAPVVAANMDSSAEPSLDGLYQPHVVLERKGRKIGIIGLITPDTKGSSNAQGVKFLDPIPTVRKEAQTLTDKGVDIIIVLSHCGLDVDKDIAREAGENIDVIVGGHSHSLLWNDDQPLTNDTVQGPYPVIVKSDSKPEHKVLVVTASSFSKYLGNLTTYFDHKGELQDFDGEPVFLNRSIPEDPEIKALLQPYADKLHTMVNNVIGSSKDSLNMDSCSFGECGIGNLVADSLVNSAKEKNISGLPHVSFMLRNMIRGSLPKGNITQGDVINTLPFSNKVVTMSIHGKHLVEALDLCLTKFWTKNPFSGPWIPQVAGLKLTFNATSGLSTSVLVTEEDFSPIDPEKHYQLTTPDFMLNEGGAFTMLRNGENITPVGLDADILQAYIAKMSEVTSVLDNRLTILN